MLRKQREKKSTLLAGPPATAPHRRGNSRLGRLGLGLPGLWPAHSPPHRTRQGGAGGSDKGRSIRTPHHHLCSIPTITRRRRREEWPPQALAIPVVTGVAPTTPPRPKKSRRRRDPGERFLVRRWRVRGSPEPTSRRGGRYGG